MDLHITEPGPETVAELDAFLGERIIEFNIQATGFRDGRPFACVVEDGPGQIVGAINGHTWGGCCFVVHLWVHASRRGRGLGRAMLLAAEEEALRRGCSQSLLMTHSFQAPDFYERLGYVRQGSLPDYPQGHSKIGFVKRLLPPAAGRPAAADASQVTLREINAETVVAVTRLKVAERQQRFVAPNAVSLAQALFAPEAWYRAIHHGDELVGFVMLEDESLKTPPVPRPGIGVWRFMVDARFQGRGIGRAAMQRVVDHVRAKGLFDTLELSYVPGPGCPEAFYLAAGFRPTGRMDDDEIVLALPLRPASP